MTAGKPLQLNKRGDAAAKLATHVTAGETATNESEQPGSDRREAREQASKEVPPLGIIIEAHPLE